MQNNSIVIWMIFGLVGFVAAEHKFPSGLTNCHRSDPKINKCLEKAIQQAFKFISSKGIPSINMPSIDPVSIVKIQIGEGSSAVALVQNYYDAKVSGFTNEEVENVNIDFDKKILTYTSHVAEIVQKAKYDVNGKILVLPVRGNGDCELRLKQVTLHHTIPFKEEIKNGVKYWKVLDYDLKIDCKGAHYHFDNLFDGDKALGDNINIVINDNWKEIFDDVKGGIEKAYGAICKIFAELMFDAVPIDEIFLP